MKLGSTRHGRWDGREDQHLAGLIKERKVAVARIHVSVSGRDWHHDRRLRIPLGSIGVSDCKLIAIEHAYDQKSGLVAGTWIDLALMLISLKFPETNAAINLVYPKVT